MNDAGVVTHAKVVPTSLVVGTLTSYQIHFTPSTDLVDGDKIFVAFPPEMSAVVSGTFTTCKALVNLKSSYCNLNGFYGIMASLFF